ncbi:VPLPA-CTERM sorting domain-containing protein [Jannaschia ovalis]|uniref:VPLPA-CTERM sorting domain-containing protein n=1 Tax=Jannaschia ovalis TaxID=3038773 RepID=A0ABY8LJ34_9RHOB|nr:VPLPA-CTERM sorting domain-containing protein [Jannaschia sp. GRR-S6-38]WGH80128.1 VPLPA-CTERM sorting domain-containing protein [Jannaschia sp. GRR-S6-38]
MVRLVPLLALCGLLLAAPAQAAVLGVFTHDYRQGLYDPEGDDLLGPDYVEISEAQANPFRDVFDFSSLLGATIDRLELTLTFSDAGPSSFQIFGFNIPTERWYLDLGEIRPEDEFGTVADLLVDGTGPLTRLVDAATDAAEGTTVFADALATGRIGFGFDEPAAFVSDSFRLYSATLTVSGTAVAVVPLPAPFWFLAAALGGLGLARRRRLAQT